MREMVIAFLLVYHAVAFGVWHAYTHSESLTHIRERKFETATSSLDRCRSLPPTDIVIVTGSSLFA